jgi:hypothetical protein
VHETYLKLVKSEGLSSEDREHFYSLAARAMRQVLIDRARAHGAQKRPEGRLRVTLDESDGGTDPGALSAELLDLDRALDALAVLDARLADLVSCACSRASSSARSRPCAASRSAPCCAIGARRVRSCRRSWTGARVMPVAPRRHPTYPSA